jgi:hypothetical protein
VPVNAHERKLLPARRLAIEAERARQIRQNKQDLFDKFKALQAAGLKISDLTTTGIESAAVGQVGETERVARTKQDATARGDSRNIPRVSSSALTSWLSKRADAVRRIKSGLSGLCGYAKADDDISVDTQTTQNQTV